MQGGEVKRGRKKKRVECLSILFLALTRWLLLMLRYTSAARQLSSKTWKQGWSAAGHGGWGGRLTPPNDPLPHLCTKELAPLFWILLINTCIEARSIQGPIQGKNFLSPSAPSLLSLPSSTLSSLLYPSFSSFLSLHSSCVSVFLF